MKDAMRASGALLGALWSVGAAPPAARWEKGSDAWHAAGAAFMRGKPRAYFPHLMARSPFPAPVFAEIGVAKARFSSHLEGMTEEVAADNRTADERQRLRLGSRERRRSPRLGSLRRVGTGAYICR